MSRFNHHPSPEYREFVETVREYAESDHDPGEHVTRAIADALEERLRDQFMRSWKLDGTTDGSNCMGRLVAGWNGCHHGVRRKGDDSDSPPHHPPHTDHADLWLRDGEPVVYTMHLYDVSSHELRDLMDFADHWGLEFTVSPTSWYYATRAVHIILYPPDKAPWSE